MSLDLAGPETGSIDQSRNYIRRLALSRWTVQIVATSLLLGIAALRTDLGDVGLALERADYVWAALAVAVLSLSKLLAAARWRLYLSAVARPPLLGLMCAYVIGTFLNALLPLRAGDFAKVQIVASRYGVSRAALSSSVFVVEAVLDLVTLLALLLVGLLFLDASFVPAAALWPLVFLAGFAFAVTLLLSHAFPETLPEMRLPAFLPEQISAGLRHAWPAFRDGLAVFRASRLLARAFAMHLAEWLMRCATFWLFGLSFALDVPAGSFLVLTVAIAVFTFFPVSFMNIGTYQVVATEVLHAAGAPRSEAFAFAITAQALSYVWVALMGLAALWALQLWPRQAAAAARPREAAAASGEGPAGTHPAPGSS